MTCLLEEDRALPPTFFLAKTLTQRRALRNQCRVITPMRGYVSCLYTLYTVPISFHIGQSMAQL